MKAKKKKAAKVTPKEKVPFHLPMSFEEAIKLAANTPIKKGKSTKK